MDATADLIKGERVRDDEAERRFNSSKAHQNSIAPRVLFLQRAGATTLCGFTANRQRPAQPRVWSSSLTRLHLFLRCLRLRCSPYEESSQDWSSSSPLLASRYTPNASGAAQAATLQHTDG